MYRAIIHVHRGEVVETVPVHQELDAYCLPCVRRHVHLRVDKPLRSISPIEDRLQDGPVGIGDVGILPIVTNVIAGAVLVPEAQRALTSWNYELLIEGAVAAQLAPIAAKLGFIFQNRFSLA